MLKIGLTGGIGSGKTVTANLFSPFGITIIDADHITRQLCTIESPAYQKIVDLFGPGILSFNQQINRRALRDIVFSDPVKKQSLENILHPLVRERIAHDFAVSTSAYCIAVIPLLIETKQYHYIDRICVVDTDPGLQIERTIQRDNATKEEIEAIMQAQVSREQRLKLADDIIVNNGNLEHLTNQINQLHDFYLSLTEANS